MDEYYRQYGIHSNIPECCVESFVEGRKAKDTEVSWGYIPCEECEEAGNRIEVHICDLSCEPFMREELELPFERIFEIMLNKVLLGELTLPNGRRLIRTDAFVIVD